jgi:hypothetical protein
MSKTEALWGSRAWVGGRDEGLSQSINAAKLSTKNKKLAWVAF